MHALPKTNADWKKELDPETYYITREKGTEPAFTGKYWNVFEDGSYHCSNCDAELFISDTKYDAGCGWPSFTKPINNTSIESRPDDSFGMHRTEVICHNCKAHLGHVFDDGPGPTKQRFCINSASLKLKPKS